MVDKEVIKKNFARCACSYDRHANIQMRSASRLIQRIKGASFSRIFEVGCGTGNYTLLLKDAFPDARITTLDISEPMVRVAQGKLGGDSVDFLVGDGELVTLGREFDLITSSAAFQWFSDLSGAIARYREFFIDGGLIAFSTFGPLTLWELKHALEEASGKSLKLSSQYFLGKEELKKILKKNLGEVKVDEETVEESYVNLRELLNKIKFTGERGNGALGIRFNPGLVRRLEEIFKTIFGQVKASYQIFYCRGRV